MKKWLIAVVSVFILLAMVLSMLMWNANGNLVDFISGQSQPEPKTLQPDISLKGAAAGQSYTAQVSIDTGTPVNTVSKEYISFAIDSSQVVGGKWWNPAGSAFWPLLGEPLNLFYGYMPQYLERSNGKIDLVSWHYYPEQSRRGPMAVRRAFPSLLLDPKNLDEVKHWAEQMKKWRDLYAPGKPIWLGETGNAQFGGEPGLSDVYPGGLWWMDQLGLLARSGHDTVVRQSLAGMNYGMIDDADLSPRPDYWNSLLWKRLMGTRAYDTKVSGDPSGKLRAYAHSGAGDEPGLLTLLLINLDHQRNAAVSFACIKSKSSQVYQFTAPDIFGKTVLLNGSELKFAPDGSLPVIQGRQRTESSADVTLAPLSYCFVTFKLQ